MNSIIPKISFCAVLCMMMLSSCRHPKVPVLTTLNGKTQGTYYAITYYADDSVNFKSSIDSLLHRFDSTASTSNPNSIISRFNKNDPSARADTMFTAIFQKAMEVSEKTEGAFDITIGPLVNAWGIGLSKRKKMDTYTIDSILRFVDFHKVMLDNRKLVKTDPHIQIDFTDISKGYAVDVIAAFLDSKGIQSYLIDIGGEVLARRTKPGGDKWLYAIEMPAMKAGDPPGIHSLIPLQDLAISTSGNYRNYYEENGKRHSYEIDPATGYPVKHSTLSVSVVAKDCLTADAYATAFMVMGVEKGKEYLKKHPKMDVYFIYSENDGSLKIYYTKGFAKLLKKTGNR